MRWIPWDEMASPQSWDAARVWASLGEDHDLLRHVHRHARLFYGARATVVRHGHRLVIGPVGPGRWLVRLRVAGLRVSAYRWPTGDDAEVEALPGALDALLAPSAPDPAAEYADHAPMDLLSAYRWRCAWCEAVLRERFRGSVPVTGDPWLEDLRVNPHGPFLKIIVRAQPPFYRIGHGRNVLYPLITETVRLDGEPDRDRAFLLDAAEPRTLASVPRPRNRGFWPSRSP